VIHGQYLVVDQFNAYMQDCLSSVPWLLVCSVYLLKHIIEMLILQQRCNIKGSFVDRVAVYVAQAMLLLDQITGGVEGHYLMVFLLRAPRHPGALQTENVPSVN
jgi:hypothetical protein